MQFDWIDRVDDVDIAGGSFLILLLSSVVRYCITSMKPLSCYGTLDAEAERCYTFNDRQLMWSHGL